MWSSAVSSGSLADRLCCATQQQLATSGVGMSLTVNDDLLEPIAGTDGARDGEALQAELGEGPSDTSSRTGRPVGQLQHALPRLH